MLTDDVVIGSVTGGDVDGAGSGVGGDELAEDDFGGSVEEGVLGFEIFEVASFHFLQFAAGFPSGFLFDLVEEFAGDDEFLGRVAVGEVASDVDEVGMDCDAEVGGEGPRGGGPDCDAQV